jgi:hypothetical protein
MGLRRGCAGTVLATTIGCKRSKFMLKEIRFCLNADEVPSLPGAYAMAIELADTLADVERQVTDSLACWALSLLSLAC